MYDTVDVIHQQSAEMSGGVWRVCQACDVCGTSVASVDLGAEGDTCRTSRA